ncbi:hypothetical protein [Nostoc sp. CALU 1950]|uniref:hypothetical protein n=1 Tax=Nostoc sp. CALU 1950 TaxID=3104321 RepID=UPI003EB795FB
MNQLTISAKIETYFLIKKLVNLIEAQILELDENLELTSEEIFEIVCQEFHLNTDFLKQALGCKCPFALIGFINELEFNDFSHYSVIIEDSNMYSQNVNQPAI